ncbi:MAG: NAD(P)-dependent oxidoreductase [Chloroflexota bacterium]
MIPTASIAAPAPYTHWRCSCSWAAPAPPVSRSSDRHSPEASRSPPQSGPPLNLGALADQVRVSTGNVFGSDVIAEAAAGADAVLCSIGAPAGFLARGATTVYSDAAAALAAGMPRAGVNRLVFCTSAGVEDHDPAEALPYTLIAKPFFFQRAYDDMKIAETTIRATRLDWTLVRPGRLTNGPATGLYAVSPRLRTPESKGISRADVATFMLDQINDSTWTHCTPTLTGPRKHSPRSSQCDGSKRHA